MEMMISNKKVTSSNKENRKLNSTLMANNINFRDLAYQKMHGLDYDELLQLQAETGLSINQLEFMYYNL